MEIDVVTGPEVKDPITNPTDEAVFTELAKGKVWRSLTSLSKILNVDSQVLSSIFLDCSPRVVRRVGKTTTYYALKRRLETPAREEEGYALAMLHMVYFQFYKILKTYGLEIGRRDPESFSDFTTALDKLESGLLLFSKKTGASVDKLPKFS